MKNPVPKVWFAKAAAALALLFSGLVAHAQNYTYYDMSVPTSATTVKTTIDGTGRILPTNRSYIIGLEGGTHGPLVFTNWVATNPLYPVIIVNKHGTGRVVISDVGGSNETGITLDNCAFIKLLGNNDPAYYYGIEVAHAGGSKRGISAGATTTNIEIGFTEVHHAGFAGMMLKTDPSETNPATWAVNFTMYDVYVHDNYVHDSLGGEGMYIGYSNWTEDHFASVPGYESHEIKGLKIAYNLIERSGWDGLQFSSAPDDPTATDDDVEVNNNIIFKPGVLNAFGQNSGIQIGNGSGGKVDNNIVIHSAITTGPCLNLIGRGYNTVYNNLLVGGYNGIYAQNLGTEDPRRTVPGSYRSVYNNTIIEPAADAYVIKSETTVNYFKNNLSIVLNTSASDTLTAEEATVITEGNLLLRDYIGAGFVNTAEKDYRVQAPSSAADVGVSLASLPTGEVSVTNDFQGLARPQGAEYDAGFSEAGALSVYLVSAPPTSGNTGSIKASAIGGTSPYTYAWSNSATTQTVSSLPQGLYSVTVTDAVGAKMTRATYLANGSEIGAPVRVTPSNEVLSPTFSPAPGTFSTTQFVSLSSATSGWSIRYTTDGSTPTPTSGTVYSGAITINNSAVITAIAYKTGMAPSVIAQGTFVIDNAPVNTKFTGLFPAESGHDSTNVVAYTVDGNASTRWAKNADGAWVSYDIGSNQRLGIVYISWYNGATRNYNFDLQVSTDNTNWTNVLTNHQSPSNAGLQGYDIPDVEPVRYVRIVCHGYNASATQTSIVDVELWGGPLGAAVAPTIITQPQSQTVTVGDTVIFSVAATGTPSPAYQWQKNGVNISGATASSYTITDVQASDAGNYDVIVSNASGLVTSSTASLTVNTGSLGLVLQAENATLYGALVRTNQTGYTGTGFADYINASGDYVEWTVSNPSAATRTLTFRYASTGPARNLSITVNGVVVNSALAFATTGGANIWDLKSMTASLPAGTLLIRATATGTSGPNMDFLQVD